MNIDHEKPNSHIEKILNKIYNDSSIKLIHDKTWCEYIYCLSCLNCKKTPLPEHFILSKMYKNDKIHKKIMDELQSKLSKEEFYTIIVYFIEYLVDFQLCKNYKGDKHIDSIINTLIHYRNYSVFLMHNEYVIV